MKKYCLFKVNTSSGEIFYKGQYNNFREMKRYLIELYDDIISFDDQEFKDKRNWLQKSIIIKENKGYKHLYNEFNNNWLFSEDHLHYFVESKNSDKFFKDITKKWKLDSGYTYDEFQESKKKY